MLSQIRATPGDWTWTYHRDPDDLVANRRAALRRFLAAYDEGLRQHRYIVGELPLFLSIRVHLVSRLCSHLLFLYSDLLSEAFHVRSVQELCRVAREVRFFPLLTLRGQPSPHLAAVRSAIDSKGWTSEVLSVNYELQRGENQMLRVFRT